MALSHAELASASARLPLVAFDADHPPLTGLAGGDGTANVAGDRVGQCLFVKTLAKRLDAPPAADQFNAAAETDAFHELRRLMLQMKETLRDRRFDGVVKHSDEVLAAAHGQAMRIQKRRATAEPALTTNGKPKVAWPATQPAPGRAAR